MGLGNRESATYATIKKGKLRVWHPGGEGEEGHEETFDQVEGYITKIGYKTREKTENMQYDPHREIQITLNDGSENVIISTAAKFGPGRAIQKMLPNINPDEMVTIKVNAGKFNGRDVTNVFMTQDSGAIKHFWKKDDMKDLPNGVEYVDPADGKTKWNMNDQVAYLEEYIMSTVAPNCHELVTATSSSSDDGGDWDGDDDAPF